MTAKRYVLSLVAAAGCLLVAACQSTPSQLTLKLKSPDPIGSSDFKTEKENTEYTKSCTVSGSVNYDIEISPSNFTGMVMTKNAVLDYGGKLKVSDMPIAVTFVDGKLSDGGISVYKYSFSDDPATYAALCSITSLNQIKLLSLGEPIMATPGIKLVLESRKK